MLQFSPLAKQDYWDQNTYHDTTDRRIAGSKCAVVNLRLIYDHNKPLNKLLGKL